MRFKSFVFAASVLPVAVSINSGCATARDYCPKLPQPSSEGDMYIPESAFTRAAANEALKDLSTQINEGVRGRDFLVQNDLNMIKGYLYRVYLAQHEKDFGSEDADLRKEFCAFLKSQAHVNH